MLIGDRNWSEVATIIELLIVIYRCILWCSKSSFSWNFPSIKIDAVSKRRRRKGKHKTNLHFYDARTCSCGCFLIIFQESTIILFLSDDLKGCRVLFTSCRNDWARNRKRLWTPMFDYVKFALKFHSWILLQKVVRYIFDISLIFDIVKVKRII